MQTYLLAIDQGTTNSRAIIFTQTGVMVAQHELDLTQSFPHDGWVEQNPEEMFINTVVCCRTAMEKAKLSARDITAIGISNQRETTIIWDKHTGKPIYPAIVWQDRRTATICDNLHQQGLSDLFIDKTGLLLDPYFSATKIMWLLDQIPDARHRANKGDLLFGTVDTYLLWKLTGGKVHATDASNASRTMLFNIKTQTWDSELLKLLNIPEHILPVVLDNATEFGSTEQSLFSAAIPITGIAGDQQSATIGQACFEPGMIKATYGTGCFMFLNTGSTLVKSKNKLLSTIAYRLNNKVTYGLEGSIFSAGTTIKWLRDTLRLITSAAETETLARSIANAGGVYLVPAFTGLGAPYWDPHARGALLGLTRSSGREHIARAALESTAYQTRDLIESMYADSNKLFATLRVDGGMTANPWLLQFIADMLNINVERPVCIETSALGAAYLAGLGAGIYSSLADISKHWQSHACYAPVMSPKLRDDLYTGWKKAVARTTDR